MGSGIEFSFPRYCMCSEPHGAVVNDCADNVEDLSHMNKQSGVIFSALLMVGCAMSLPSAAYSQEVDAAVTSTSQSDRPTIALALGGGGARGAAHIGVLRALEQNGLKPDIVVGNSMGSIVGSLYCAGVPLDEIEKLVVDGRLRKAYAPVPIPIQVIKKIGMIPFNPFKKKPLPGFYSGESLAEFINDSVPEDKRSVESLSPKFAAVAVNLLDGQAYRLTKGDLGQAVRASASLPPLLKPCVIDGNVYADGGIRANMPTYPARAMGADIVIAVDVNEPLKDVPVEELKSLGSMANRMTSIVLAVVDELHLKVADYTIKPNVAGIPLLSRDEDDFKTAVAHGEDAARKAVPEIRKKLDDFKFEKDKTAHK